MTTREPNLDDLMDRLVAEYSDRVAEGDLTARESLLARVPAEHRASLERCFRMIECGVTGTPSAMQPLAPGRVLAGYRIDGVIGRGGMSTVFHATQLDLNRHVALKVLRPGLALESRHVERFHREATAIAKLDHPNIVTIYSVGQESGYHFLAMEFIDGPNLADVIRALPHHRPLQATDLDRASGIPGLCQGLESYERAFAAVMAPLVRALSITHELGLIHRDIKPSNILLRRDGRPVLADFGLAKDDQDLALSLTGEPLGTPYYMSPEQVAQSRHRVDERTDIYSMGVTLYEGLTGRRPFEGETALALFDAIRRETPPPVRLYSPETSRDAQAVIRRAMAREAGDRYASAMELAVELNALAQGAPTKAGLDEGTPFQSFMTGLSRAARGYGFRYRSPDMFLGIPLVDVHLEPRGPGRKKWTRAKGWIAIGDIAVGGIAIGNLAVGLISLGSLLGVGLFGLAGVLGVGLLASGGAGAIGGLALGGGCGIGILAVGGFAAGLVAVGGQAYGYYVIGGLAKGKYVISGEYRDPVAVEWFQNNFQWLMNLLQIG